MQKSETIGELAKALAIVQGKLEGAKKDAENPFFKSKYADLSSVWEACRGLLSDNGLSVVQTNTLNGHFSIVVDTTLMHSSGEWISGQLGLKAVKDDPPGAGSAITYARRYALAAIVGIAPEDDDAEGAVKRDKPPAQKPKPQATTAKSEPTDDGLDRFYQTCMKAYALTKEKVAEKYPGLDLTTPEKRKTAWEYIDKQETEEKKAGAQ